MEFGVKRHWSRDATTSAVTPTGFLPWPLQDKSLTVVPLYIDARRAMIFRVRRSAGNL